MIDVSVIIPYHQDRGYLFDAIESYEAQEFTGTSELILSHNPTYTLGQNINAGLAQAKGKYVKILPDDDLLTPNSLQSLFDFAEANSADVVFAQALNFNDGIYIGSDSQGLFAPSTEDFSLTSLLRKNFIHGGTTLYRTSMIREVGGFDDTLWTAEEYEFHLRCLSQDYSFHYLPEVVFEYRLWPGSKSIGYRVSQKVSQKAKRDQAIAEIKARFGNL